MRCGALDHGPSALDDDALADPGGHLVIGLPGASQRELRGHGVADGVEVLWSPPRPPTALAFLGQHHSAII